MRFKRRGMRWMRILHIVSTGIWFGATVAVLGLGAVAFFGSTPQEFVVVSRTMSRLYQQVLVPMAVFTVLQGVVYGLWTQWGFFKHRWVLWKWVCTPVVILFLGVGGIAQLPAAERSVHAGTFVGGLADGWGFLLLVGLQVAIMLVMFWLSVFKPGKAKPERAGRDRREPAASSDAQPTPRPARGPDRRPGDTRPARGPGGPPAQPDDAPAVVVEAPDLSAQIAALSASHASQVADLRAQLAEALAARETALDQVAAAMAELATSTGPTSPDLRVLAASTGPLTPARTTADAPVPVPTTRATGVPPTATPAPAPDAGDRPVWLDPTDVALCNDCGTCYQELPALFERTTVLVDGVAEVVARLREGALDGLVVTPDLARRIARVKATCDAEIIR